MNVVPVKLGSAAAPEDEPAGGAMGAALFGCGGVALSNFVCVKNGVGERVLAREKPTLFESPPDAEEEEEEEDVVTPPRLDPARFGS